MICCVIMFITYWTGSAHSSVLAENIYPLISGVIGYLIMKHCAYKKYGTMYMTWIMVLAILYFVANRFTT